MTAPVDRDREELARVLHQGHDLGGDVADCLFCWDDADALAPAVTRREARAAAKALEVMATVFEADAKHLVGGAAYLHAADDCRTYAAELLAAALDTEGKADHA